MALEVSRVPNARHNARGDAAKRSTTSLACSSARNAAASASVFPLAFMATKVFALATITGRPKKEDPSALNLINLGPLLRPRIDETVLIILSFLLISHNSYPCCILECGMWNRNC
ncbi:OLC1v1009570C1 [Oldenlandia corymbosa var. corymbosa]|uniref:OLC1v1009570C1 n=1 Tax=Oldenlandia corymbosa var. corymbosa TaxID=529605 RepID=A0AAV1DSH3_OLDCO|nr:OLC1v1009570C1 [Oldenlandia corymbosa var. corymbosa]